MIKSKEIREKFNGSNSWYSLILGIVRIKRFYNPIWTKVNSLNYVHRTYCNYVQFHGKKYYFILGAK